MKRVGGILHHFRDWDAGFEAWARGVFVYRAKQGQMFRTLRSQNRIGRPQEISHRTSFAHKLRVVADSKVQTSTASAGALKNRNHHRFGCAGKNGAAQNNYVTRFLLLESHANLAGDALHMAQVEFATSQAGG